MGHASRTEPSPTPAHPAIRKLLVLLMLAASAACPAAGQDLAEASKRSGSDFPGGLGSSPKLDLFDRDLFQASRFGLGTLANRSSTEAAKHVEAAREATAKGQHKSALKELNQAIGLKPGDAETIRLRSSTFASLALYRHAINDLDIAIGIDGPIIENLARRGWAYCAERDMKRGLADFGEALASTTDEAWISWTLYWRADAFRLNGDYSRAAADLERAAANRPDRPIDHASLGDLLAKAGEHPRAIEEFEKAARGGYNAPELYHNRGEAYLAIGRFDLALADGDRAVALAPDRSWAHQGRAFALLMSGRVDAALAEFDRAVELGPTIGRTFAQRGWARLAKGDLEQAEKDFDRAETFHPGERLDIDVFLGWDPTTRPIYDHAMVEFEHRAAELPSMRLACVAFVGDEARSHATGRSELAFFLLVRPLARAGLAPSLIFRIAHSAHDLPADIASPAVGRAIIALRRSDRKKALEEIEYSLNMLLESRFPGSTSPPGGVWDELTPW